MHNLSEEEKDTLLNHINTIVQNTKQTYADRVMSISLMLAHSGEFLTGQPFPLNIAAECKRIGASKRFGQIYFAAMEEAGGITINKVTIRKENKN